MVASVWSHLWGSCCRSSKEEKYPPVALCGLPRIVFGSFKRDLCFGEAVLWFPCSLSCVSFSGAGRRVKLGFFGNHVCARLHAGPAPIVVV